MFATFQEWSITSTWPEFGLDSQIPASSRVQTHPRPADVSLLRYNVKIKFKEYFYISLPVGVKSNQVVFMFPDCAIIYHVSTPWAVGAAKHHRQIELVTHSWQQWSITISADILTTKYDFNLREIAPLCWLNSSDNDTDPATFQSAKWSPFVYVRFLCVRGVDDESNSTILVNIDAS